MPSALMYPERRIVPMPNDAAKVIDMSDMCDGTGAK